MSEMQRKEERKELNRILEMMHEMCWECDEKETKEHCPSNHGKTAGQWNRMDDVLKGVDVENTSITLLLAYLTTSAWVKKHLSYREEFYKKVEEKLKDHPEREGLLDGLK